MDSIDSSLKLNNYYGSAEWEKNVKEKEKLYTKYNKYVERNEEVLDSDYIVEHNIICDKNNRYIGDKCKLLRNKELIFEWTNYYSKSLLHKIINHNNGKRYFIYNEDLYGYSVVDLDSKEHINYIPYESYLSPSSNQYKDTFIFCDAFYNKYNSKIAIEGCIWAAPYSIIVFDFKNPLDIKTIKEWKDVQDIESTEYHDIDFFKWKQNNLITKNHKDEKEYFECS